MPPIPKRSAPKQAKSRLHYVGECFRGFEKNGQGYRALCPVHNDTKPSLSISEGKDGRVLVHCHAGCRTRDVLEIVGLRERDLFPDSSMIVDRYDYHDEHGSLLYQALRMDPKSFRQRRPEEKGGWSWSLKGVRRVLYRLPELLAANPSEPVYVTEGEKDADRLAGLGFLATTVAGGAKAPWLSDYTEVLRGRSVVLLPDNDVPGWERVEDVARKLGGAAAEVRIVELPGLPEKGDVSDWLDASGTADRLRRIVSDSPAYASTLLRDDGTGEPSGSDPTDGLREPYGSAKPQENPTDSADSATLRNTLRDGATDEPETRRPVETERGEPSGRVEPFPVDVFPAPLRKFATSVADALPCPPDFPGSMMLAVLATCIGRRRCVEIKPSWQEYPVLWIACVARSGDRKTPAFEIVTAPIRQRQRQLQAEFLRELREWRELPKEQQAEADPPRLKQALTTDATIEAMKDVLASNPLGVIFLADELAGWARSMSQYKGGRGDDRQHWLSIWSGQQIVCNRKGSPPIVINDPFVSVTGGIQPDALGDIVEDGREDGFAARPLFAYPDAMPPAEWSEAAVTGDVSYKGICDQLWEMEPSAEPVRLSSEAKAVFVEWVNDHRREEPPENLRATWSKCEGHCARLALILHLTKWACNSAPADLIDAESVHGAVRLIDYFKSHAKRVYGVMVAQVDNGRIGRALKFIRRHGGKVTARMMRQYGYVGETEEAEYLFDDLAELGHGTKTKEARNSLVFRLRDPSDPA